MTKCYAAIDLKAFYSSVECHERRLDPLDTNLVVANESRTDKTICLAISPALKTYGLPGRARLFEVNDKVKAINYERRKLAPGHRFRGKSAKLSELKAHPEYELDFIIASPRMQYYLNYSKEIYETYLDFVAAEDIFAYSIDEVFCDLTSYLKYSHLTGEEFVTKMIKAVYNKTGITATAGIGTNMYLAKVAMDIIAKHAEPNQFGARLAYLDETLYKQTLWDHEPIRDFWRVGPGISKKLKEHQMYTMGDVARCSLSREDLLYDLFGVNAELLIDHAWGIEPTRINDVKNYEPSAHSLNNGQVLPRPYRATEARTIVKEMAEALALELAHRNYETDQLVFYARYSNSTHLRGTRRLNSYTNSIAEIRENFLALFDQKFDQKLSVKKLYLTAGNLKESPKIKYDQPTLFQKPRKTNQKLENAILKIREKFGENAILTGSNFEEGATGRERHGQIGGHKA